MYLTRCQINARRREARLLLTSPQAMHSAVLGGFASQPSAEDGRILWRVDHGREQIFLYIVSPKEPDLTHLVEQAGWPTTETWETRSYEKLLGSLTIGQQWAFRLRANPVRNVKPRGDDVQGRSRRFGHVTVDQQKGWLIDRTERAGFRITAGADGEPDVIIHNRSTARFRRGPSTVSIRMATFDGRLEICDADSFRQTLVHGLGHAKAYGCGLLTLASPQ